MIVLRDGDPGGVSGGGGVAELAPHIPAEFKSEASLASIKDVPTLVKSYVSAQKMLGSRVPLPQEDWKPEQFDEFYNKLGRPVKPEEYKLPEVKMHENVQLDKEKLGKATTQLHKMGLTQKQAAGVMEYYFNSLNEGVGEVNRGMEAQRAASTEILKKEWGDRFDANLGLAKQTLTKLGSPELVTKLDLTGFGNDPDLIKVLHKVSLMMQEDKGGRGIGGNEFTGTSADAIKEIGRLKGDETFMKQLNDAENPGHKEAVEKWLGLHNKAYPGTNP